MLFERAVWGIYNFFNWIFRLMYLNVLWIVFTTSGLFIFGFFPATAAMFSVTRKWILGESEVPIFKTFYTNFKTSFVQINIIGYLLIVFGYFLYLDINLIKNSGNLILNLFIFLLLFASIIFYVVLLNVFPIYAHYQFKTFKYIRKAIVLTLGKPLNTIMMIVGSYIIYLIISTVPYLFIFFGGSLFSLLLMWISMRFFTLKQI